MPSEVAMRYMAAGYKAIAITDHVDYSNIEFTVKAILEFTRHWPLNSKIKVLPGIELTHLPPNQFKPLTQFARKQGIKVIIGHGETLMEPVEKGVNRAALEAEVDILAHPGLVNDSDVKLAKEKGIFLEVTSRKGHRDTNAHVVERALKFGARLILNNDSHEPEDIITPEELIKVGMKAGLKRKEIDKTFKDVEAFLRGRQNQ